MKTPIRFERRSLTLAMLMALGLPFAAQSADKEPIRIGAVTSISGVWAQQGEEVMRGIEFAIEEANKAGGVDGRKVEIRKADDEGTPDAGRREAEKLARSGYNLLVGPIASSITMAIGQNLQRWNALQISVISKSDKITGDSCKPRMFRTAYSDAMDIAMFDAWMKDVPGKNYAVVGADYIWGRDSAQHFTKAAQAAGKTVPLSVFPPLGTKDFAPYIAQIKAIKDLDGVWVALVGRDLIAFARQAKEFGLTEKRIIGHAFIMNFVVDASGDATEGVWGNMGYGADIDTPMNKTFVAGWQAKFGRVPTDNEGQAYNGTRVIFEGVKLAKSVKPGDVAKALQGANYESIYGQVTMRAADNQQIMGNYIGQVKRVDGKLRPVVERAFPASLSPAPSPDCKM